MVQRYRKGRRKEYVVCRELEKAGFAAQRYAGSHSNFDVHGYNADMHRLIQVKSNKYEAKKAIRELEKIDVPLFTQREVWLVQDRREIEIFIC